jgi:hypothetical protein
MHGRDKHFFSQLQTFLNYGQNKFVTLTPRRRRCRRRCCRHWHRRRRNRRRRFVQFRRVDVQRWTGKRSSV